MQKSLLLLLCILIIGALLPCAQEGSVNANPLNNVGTDGNNLAALEKGTLACHLILLGCQQKSPVLLIAAAELLADLNFLLPTEEAIIPLEPKAILEKAREFAAENEELVTIVNTRLSALGQRKRGISRTLGQGQIQVAMPGHTFVVVSSCLLKQGDTQILSNVTFDAETLAVVRGVGEGNGNLDLYVYDENGKEIGKDIAPGNRPEVKWNPERRGSFKLTFKNVGPGPVACIALANWQY